MEKEGVKIVDKAQAGSMYRREYNLRRELFLFLWFSSFGECLSAINVEAHATRFLDLREQEFCHRVIMFFMYVQPSGLVLSVGRRRILQ